MYIESSNSAKTVGLYTFGVGDPVELFYSSFLTTKIPLLLEWGCLERNGEWKYFVRSGRMGVWGMKLTITPTPKDRCLCMGRVLKYVLYSTNMYGGICIMSEHRDRCTLCRRWPQKWMDKCLWETKNITDCNWKFVISVRPIYFRFLNFF